MMGPEKIGEILAELKKKSGLNDGELSARLTEPVVATQSSPVVAGEGPLAELDTFRKALVREVERKVRKSKSAKASNRAKKRKKAA